MNRLRAFEALGPFLVKVAVLGFFGFEFAFVPSDGLFGGPELSLVCGLFTAFVAATLNVIFSAMIGLSAFFIEDTSPVYWLWQKLGFALGGLIFPLDLYPDTVSHLACAPPFPSLLEAPARIAIGAGSPFIWPSGFVLGGWLVVAALSTHFTCRRALQALKPNES